MPYTDIEFARTLQHLIEFLGTFAFAISGIRHAAAKHFDWFGGFVCGFAVAIGGGTIRDVMLGVTPFWMTSPVYIICTVLAQLFVISFAHKMRWLDNAWFVFDTLGLALFTIAGIQKTLSYDHPFWVAIVMGCITGGGRRCDTRCTAEQRTRDIQERDLRHGQRCGRSGILALSFALRAHSSHGERGVRYCLCHPFPRRQIPYLPTCTQRRSGRVNSSYSYLYITTCSTRGQQIVVVGRKVADLSLYKPYLYPVQTPSVQGTNADLSIVILRP